MSHWHFFISSYYLTVSHLLSLTALKSEELTLSSGSFNWGRYIVNVPGVTLTFHYISLFIEVSHWHFLISSYYLTVSNLLSWTALKVKSSLWALAVSNGGGYIVRCTWCHTDMSLYLPIIWLFQICSHWLHWKVKSSLWALAVSNGGVYGKMYLVSHWHVLISSYYLTVLNGLSLIALKKWRVHSELWQFWMGGLIVRFTLNLKIWAHFKFSLYLPIIWLFQMGSHWPYWKVKSSLWALAVLNRGVNCQIYSKYENLSSFQVFLISSYYLTVSNGCSLVPLKSVELTQCSGSFEWGVNCQIYPKSENLSSLSLYFLIIWLFQMDAHWQHWKA